MKAAVLYGNNDIRYGDWENPVLRQGCVKIKVKACGICGSDVPRVLNHGAHFYPIILGHEFSGYVTEVAEDVKNIHIGSRVAGVPLVPCMQCADCQKGNYSQCRHYSFIGSREQGGYGEYVVLPAQNIVVVDERLPYEQIALFEPCTVALHGLKAVDYRGGKRVAVLGGGTIGLFALQWAKIYGASQVVVFGRNKEHLKLAKKLGADHVISTLDDKDMQTVDLLTDGHGFDYIFETAGSTYTMQLSFELAASRASICFIGTPTQDLHFAPSVWENMNRKEFRLTGSWMSCSAPFPGDEWTETAHFFGTGILQYDPEMYHAVYRIQDVAAAFKEFEHRDNVKGRILLLYE